MNTELSFPLSPSDIELIHRTLDVNPLANFNAYTVNTGGNCMNDLYILTDGRVLVVYEYGAALVPSISVYEDSDYDQYSFLEWGSETLDDLTLVWQDNCELIFGDMGSADDMLAEHSDISIHEREWVNSFITKWEGLES